MGDGLTGIASSPGEADHCRCQTACDQEYDKHVHGARGTLNAPELEPCFACAQPALAAAMATKSAQNVEPAGSKNAGAAR